ncbi:MAG: sulfite exporter TauE/SafE family protein [Waddliaceae bacterium]
MTLLFSMLPFYLLGNLHCMGMCGPLVMTIGLHPHRLWYFFGRTLSFSLAGAVAGGLGAVLSHLVQLFHIPAITSLLFGGVVLFIGLKNVIRIPSFSFSWMNRFNHRLTRFALSPHPFSLFLFGFFTVLLPCGQTIVVFSACALVGSVKVGLINGFVFALLTSPSLLLAMHSHRYLAKWKTSYNSIFIILCFIAGSLSICRGLAELEWISHLELFKEMGGENLHFVLY